MSRRKGFWNRLASLCGFLVLCCRDCGCRHEIPFWGIGRYARCPHCLREDLSDWSEPYRLPNRFFRALRYFGAREHRCAPCRINFVSFRPRRAAYVPSWRRPESHERSAAPASATQPDVSQLAR
ncbi:MAG: hypothetical protein R2729_00475 [Bryobacteraceae bacterium]